MLRCPASAIFLSTLCFILFHCIIYNNGANAFSVKRTAAVASYGRLNSNIPLNRWNIPCKASKCKLYAATSDDSSSVSTNVDTSENIWKYQGHDVYTQVSVGKNTKVTKSVRVVLVHGFACSTTYWRATIEALVKEGYEVHAMDLLGQGKSAKPGRADGIEYSISLWADLVNSYIRENVVANGDDRDVVLAGNSLGSLIALSAVTSDYLCDNIN